MFVIGTAGHVDHGKSTLIEALTGIDPDRLAEEKQRGMTIDLGFAWFKLPSGDEVSIVDVPGHERFIKNMLAGVGGIDLALLVIAADEGVMPQTREHLAILDLLGVSRGILVLTKRDLGRPRLPIDRVFTISGFGTVVTGTLIDGALSAGEEVEIVPSGVRENDPSLKSRIRGLQSHRSRVDRALPGTRTAINLAGVDTEDLRRGQIVTTPGWL